MALALILILISYLMGSVCSAIIVSRIFNLPDPREEGSKNPGATNVLRLAGKQYAALVLLVDMLKGTIPVLIAKFLDASPEITSLTVLVVVLGHMYPIFFNFKGGKGVATAIGALLGFNFIIGVMVIATWLLVINFTHYSSLASIISTILAPLYSLLLIQDIRIFPPICFMAILILFKHKNNIVRLIDGKEPKVFIKQNVIKEIMEESHPEPANDPIIKQSKPISIKKKSVKKITTETENSTKKTISSKKKLTNPEKTKSKAKTKSKTTTPEKQP